MTASASIFLESFAKACKPRVRLSLSQWADAHRVLSAKASSEAGRWKTSRTPYLREIMDCLSDHSPVQRVVVMKSAQLGATEVALNWIGYVMAHSPAPMLVVAPTLEVRDRWIMQRLHPMLRETETIAELFDAHASRALSNSKDIKDFPGGMLVLSGANSPSSLRSMPIRYVICDEVDAFPWEVGSEGDPLGLVQARTANFPRRKVMLISTPTVRDASRIEEEYQRSDRRTYHVPCPHCGEYQVLIWSNLRWHKSPGGHVSHARYVCRECGAEIEEHHKPEMLAKGRWVPEVPESPVRGYHINGLYAPIGLGYSWLELAQEWQSVHDDPPKLKRFVNTVLAESWHDRSRDIKPSSLSQRAEPYALRTLPPGCLILTAGIDTQDDRLSVQILGWGRGEVCWVIDWFELPGDPARDEVWMALSEKLNTPLRNAFGMDLVIQAAAIDTGGHHTHQVYTYARSNPAKRVIAIKGSQTPSRPILAGRPSAVDVNHRGRVIRGGVKLYMVGTDTAKSAIFARLAADADTDPAQRLIHFSEGLDEDYYAQLTSEAFDPQHNRWVKRRGRRNEGLDTFVYAMAAAHHPEVRVHAMRVRDWEALETLLEPGRPTENRLQPIAVPESENPPTKQHPPRSRGNRRGGGLGRDDWVL
jgi:phage terminase large subunit GpA-like protein